MNIDINKWKEFSLKELFDFENCKCSNASNLVEGDEIFYIGAKKEDNGFMKKVAYDEKLITKGNCIIFICDGQGSVGYCNYMDRDFIGSTTLTVGYNKNLNRNIGLFFVTILDLQRSKYSFGRKYRKHLSDTIIKLPTTKNGSPDYDWMEKFINYLNCKEITTKVEKQNLNLEIETWKEFKLGDLFEKKYKAKAYIKSNLSVSNSPRRGYINFITRTDENNGCDCYVLKDDSFRIEKGNAIIFGDTTATCFYQENEFLTGDHIVVCRANWINKKTALFLKTILQKERYRYCYGRAFKMDLIENTIIKLPSNKYGNPDWAYMEEVIESLPFGDRI